MIILPCLDSAEQAAENGRALNITAGKAVELGRSGVDIATQGWYLHRPGHKVDIRREVQAACAGKLSLPPEAPLPDTPRPDPDRAATCRLQVTNETTLMAARRLLDAGVERPVALNFANGLVPGGGLLVGGRAQEEVLCRSSALYPTLVGDPMYEAHRVADSPDASDWVIYSPDVPVFRTDAGALLAQPWPLSVITCAAPYAPKSGRDHAAELMPPRIRRVLAVAQAMGHRAIVLGAWGCGAFGNDPESTACAFREALEGPFAQAFDHVVFAITDRSPERRTLGPFRDAFPGTRAEKWPAVPATRDDFRITPMPESHVDIAVDCLLPAAAMDRIRLGVVPDAMEDKWFVYWEDGHLYFHRSWTGFCVYVARIVEDAGDWRVTSIRANREPGQYSCDDDDEDAGTALFVLHVVVLQLLPPPVPEGEHASAITLATWSLVGRAMLGQHPG